MPRRNQDFQPDHPHLAALHSAFFAKSFQCPSGTIAVKPGELALYYDTNDGANVCKLDFLHATDADLNGLADACAPATFGLNDKDVLDENYRKAGVLDDGCFAINFDPGRTGLLKNIRDALLEGHDDYASIRCELYKLNVYGPGHFFKVHKDTPREDSMFASLVVVLPTVHTGGALVFRHETKEFTFDSAAELSNAAPSSVAFVAFHSDIDHEVKPVISGYRVTLTYNLYFDSQVPSLSKAVSISGGQEAVMKDALKALMSDAEYLPDGGFIGFSLRHQYPLTHERDSVQQVRSRLKGCDALLAKVCDELGLTVSLWIAYEAAGDERVLSPTRVDMDGFDCEYDCMWLFMRRYYNAKLITEAENEDGEQPPDMIVHWATELRGEELGTNGVKEAYIAYGNEHELAAIYGELCLLVHVGRFGERTTPPAIPENKNAERNEE